MSLPYNFNDKERKIEFSRHDLPTPWINYLSNGSMHAFVSQAGGGLTWWRTPTLFRLTRYRMYNLPIDSPGFYIYIRMANGTVWSPSFRPAETPLEAWQASHKPGFTSFTAQKNGIKAELTLFVAMDSDTLVWDLKLTNLLGESVDFDVFAYVELSQFAYISEVNLGYYLKWQTREEYDKDTDAIIYVHNSFVHPRVEDSPAVFFASSEEITSYCCDRDKFCGHYRYENNPIAVEKGICDNSNLNGGEGCAALHTRQSLKANEQKSISFFLGVAPNGLKDCAAAKKYTAETLKTLKSKGGVEAQFNKVQKWWDEHLDIMQCDIPDESSMRQINTWNPLQSVHTARLSRSISSTASGIRGIGFRDTAQDMLAQAYRKPEWAAEMLLYLASLQFEDGHPVHQSWPEEERLPQADVTRSDNHIWLSYLAYAIIAETGDLSLLDKEVPFLAEDLVSKASSATLWEHLMRGVEFTENNIGKHGLPLILYSDWNDHFGPFGRKGKGETVFVSQQHIYSLRLLSELAAKRKDTASVEKLQKLIEKQTEALNKYAWDGEWWVRGFDDNGNPVGTKTADKAKIWVNTQSWAVIAGVNDKERLVKAMDSVREHLDTGIGVQINAPGFPETDPSANGLPPGYSENAGVFCQANCWAIMAEALLGRADNAWKYYKELIPHEVIKKIGLEAYHAEAYAYASTLLGKENERHGWATVSQVTGTAAWMDVVSTQYLLGIRPQLDGLLIDPCIPSDWKKYSVKRTYRGCDLTIEVENPNGVQKGIKSIVLNGNPVDITGGAIIKPELLKGCEAASVKVVMG